MHLANPSLAFSKIKVSIQGCILHSKLGFAYQLHHLELVSHTRECEAEL